MDQGQLQGNEPGLDTATEWPSGKSWAQVIGEANRRCRLYQARIDELCRRVGELTVANDMYRSTIARLEEEIAGLFDCLGWDVDASGIEATREDESCQEPPF